MNHVKTNTAATHSFDLVDEKWLPVRSGSSNSTVSMRELFAEPGQFSALADLLPIEEVAVVRILSAVYVAATGGESSESRMFERVSDGLPSAEVLEYLDSWRPRFDLFHASHPFMQSKSEPEAELVTVAALRLDLASGNNATLHSHTTDDAPPALTAGEALVAMLTTLLFQPGGGVSKPFNRTDSPATKRVLGLIHGRDIGETIMLNSPIVRDGTGLRPAWERDADERPEKEGTPPKGWLDLATWRSRRIRLYRDADGYVRYCKIQQHLKLDDQPPTDPYVPIFESEKDGLRAVRPSSYKSIWRQADSILFGFDRAGTGTGGTEAVPTTVKTASGVCRDLGLSDFPVLVVGLNVEQAKVADMQSSELAVPTDIYEGRRSKLEAIAWALVDQGDGCDTALRKSIWKLHSDLGAADSADAALRDARDAYWHRLEIEFGAYVKRLADGEPCLLDTDIWRIEWNSLVRASGHGAFNAISGRYLGSRGRAAKAVAAGWRTFFANAPTRLAPQPAQSIEQVGKGEVNDGE